MIYRGMDRAALDAAYNNTAAVGQAKRDAYVAGWTKRSDAIRTTPGARIDLRYGEGARHRLDVFPSLGGASDNGRLCRLRASKPARSPAACSAS